MRQGLRFTLHLTGTLEGGAGETGVVPSTGSAGDCYDNAMAESFFATLECELIDRRSFQTQAEARMAIFEYLEAWYNTRRLHSRAGVSESERVRTSYRRGRPDGRPRSSRTNHPRTLPARPAGDPEPPSGETPNNGLRQRVPSTGYRPPQCRWRQPSTVHRNGVGPSPPWPTRCSRRCAERRFAAPTLPGRNVTPYAFGCSRSAPS